MQLFFVYNNTKLYCFFSAFAGDTADMPNQSFSPHGKCHPVAASSAIKASFSTPDIRLKNATPPSLFRFPLTRRLYIKYNKPNITRRKVR